jgi:hypothetical protein
MIFGYWHDSWVFVCSVTHLIVFNVGMQVRHCTIVLFVYYHEPSGLLCDCHCCLSNMKSPYHIHFLSPYAALPLTGEAPMSWRRADLFVMEIIKDFSTIVQITCHSGHYWARLSGSIFSVKQDYIKLQDILVKKFTTMK